MADLFLMCLAGVAFIVGCIAAYRAVTRPVQFGPPLHFAATSQLLERAADESRDEVFAAVCRERATKFSHAGD